MTTNNSGIAKSFIVLSVLLLFLLAGCASTRHGDEEGGITGTGHNIDCTDAINHKRKDCIE